MRRFDETFTAIATFNGVSEGGIEGMGGDGRELC
jgi:hypothetical protein